MPEAKFRVMTIGLAINNKLDKDIVEKLQNLVSEVKSKTNILGVRHGHIETGHNAGKVIVAQTYASMADIEAAYDVMGQSDAYQDLLSVLSVERRNIGSIEVSAQSGSGDPKYAVLTVVTSKERMIEEAQHLAKVFAKNGALRVNYGTILTGDNTGSRLLGALYPSMSAIETAYDAIRSDEIYNSVLSKVSIRMRQIVRLTG